MNNLKTAILEKITEGKVVMKPKWHFVLHTLLLALGGVIAGLVAIYLMSFVMVTLRMTGLSIAPQFGFRGIMFFLHSSPWVLILLVLVFLAILYLLVTHFAFSYKRPHLYTLIGVVLFTLLVSTGIQYTRMHDRFGSFAMQNNVPGMAPLYRMHMGERPEGIVVGRVSEVLSQGFVLQTDEGEKLTVLMNADTRVRPGTSLALGERCLILGERTGDIIEALGIKNVSDDFTPPPPGSHPMRGSMGGMMHGERY